MPEDVPSGGFPAGSGVFPVGGVRLRVLEGDHPFHLASREAAAANWQAEITANPALFNGRMVFQHRLSFFDGIVVGEGYLVPYSTFLWWRRQPGGAGGFHVFGFPVIVSADGALIAVRMARHTANAGQVYFAAGSLDPNDIVEGYCDIAGNMAREVFEETGLNLAEAESDGRYFATYSGRRLTILRLFRFSLSSAELLERIAAHMAVDEEKEIAGAVAIHNADPTAHPYNRAMFPVLDWFFAKTR
ncbi:DNA mismatch repair protein MutT [Ciceribacter naphthalenivorans]|uniref:DNA mismatch repair protein MutT n=1 Tax=Sphingomonas psychrolutea TaxID=1259676 RepID=A0ABQ6E6Q6_9SPHN|nr:DNA mismatch repair protein MutT [Ciceribacter naphthalenivorans]GLT03385.1 DNA mismatch repair protein MutT [Sphingomonas psychrolutea]